MRRYRPYVYGIIALLITGVFFIIPFIFIFLQSVKTKREASRLNFTLPSEWHLWDNLKEVVQTQNYQLVLAYYNSIVITVVAVTLLVVFAAMVGYIMQRRKSKWNKVIMTLLYVGLIMPPAVVPTIGLLQSLGIFKTISSMICIQVAYNLPFTILMYRAFIANIPRDLDEAAVVDGAKPWQVFFRVVMPLLKPVTVTVILLQSITIFNDFTNPLYYLPGRNNVTVQLTLYNFQSQFTTQYNLLFMNILLVTIPPLILYVFFNRKIVAGMTSGAVKG